MLKPRLNENVIQHAIGDGNWMLYDTDKGLVHVVNDIAYEFFTMCNGERTLEDICKEINKKYGEVSFEQILNDGNEIIKNFNELGVLE